MLIPLLFDGEQRGVFGKDPIQDAPQLAFEIREGIDQSEAEAR